MGTTERKSGKPPSLLRRVMEAPKHIRSFVGRIGIIAVLCIVLMMFVRLHVGRESPESFARSMGKLAVRLGFPSFGSSSPSESVPLILEGQVTVDSSSSTQPNPEPTTSSTKNVDSPSSEATGGSDLPSFHVPTKTTPTPTQTAMHEVRKGQMESQELQDVQHTPSGAVALGHSFFRRLQKLTWMSSAVVDRARQNRVRPGEPPLRPHGAAYERLHEWHQRHPPQFPIRADKYREEENRFRTLADKPSRSDEESQEMWKLIVHCGRYELRIPFDEAAQEFDLSAELPEDAPEVAISNMNKLVDLYTQAWNERHRPPRIGVERADQQLLDDLEYARTGKLPPQKKRPTPVGPQKPAAPIVQPEPARDDFAP